MRTRDRRLSALAAGALFGAGLVISGMTDPRNVLGFLDFAGDLNPRLVAVMAGAVGVHALLLRLTRNNPRMRAGTFRAREGRIDGPLLVGSAIFGVGWGLSGYCPGPAITSMGLGAGVAFGFLVAMLAGVFAADRLVKPKATCE
jgi:uncharacterized protein